MAASKITFEDKEGLDEYGVRIHQVQDRDINEIKNANNTNADIIDLHTTEIEGLTAAQTGGLKSFTTLALLEAYATPNVNDSYVVTSDTTASKNGYYHWVSGTNYVKDTFQPITTSNLSQTLNSASTTTAASEKAVADYSATLRGGTVASGETKSVSGGEVFNKNQALRNDENQFKNVFSDNSFDVGLFSKVGGTGSFEYVTYNGVKTLHISDCIIKAEFDLTGNVDLTKNWSFTMFINQLNLSTSNIRIVAQALKLNNSQSGDRLSVYKSTNLTNETILSDNYAFDTDAVKFQIYIDCTGDEMYCSNFFIGNAPYAKFVPYNSDKANIATNTSNIATNTYNISANAIKTQKVIYKNVIPNNAFINGLDGWENPPSGVTGVSITRSLESVTNPFSSKVLRFKAGSSTNSFNFDGIALKIGSNFAVGDTVVFRGLIKKSLGTSTPYIQIFAKSSSFTTLQTTTSSTISTNSTGWLETGDVELVIPASTEWIFIIVRSWVINESIDITGWTLTKKYTSLNGVYLINDTSTSTSSTSSDASFYVSKTGSDSNVGSSSLPFLTISKAISSSVGKNTKILISGGDYRETLDFSTLNGTENIELIAKQNEKVRILGSTALSGFSKTTGYTNIYEATYTGTILTYIHNVGKRIFEDGRSSKPILSAEEHALQRGLTHRLPYTDIFEETFVTDLATTLTNLDVNAGHFYYDGSKIYIHATDSDSILTNGYSYEIANKPVTSNVTDSMLNARFTNINFYYGSTGFSLGKAKSIYRMACSVFGCYGNGFTDNSNRVLSYKDESAGNDTDGINGHYNTVTDWANSDLRNGSNQGFYFDAWCHDNADDGISFHERGEFQVYGGLYEYNGDRGVAPASGCNLTGYNVTARKNGQMVGIDSGAVGEGFSCVNASVDGRNGTSASLFNCISENNVKGYSARDSVGNKMTLINCIARNNTTNQLEALDGSIISKNTLATGVNLKVVTGTGVITIENDTILT